MGVTRAVLVAVVVGMWAVFTPTHQATLHKVCLYSSPHTLAAFRVQFTVEYIYYFGLGAYKATVKSARFLEHFMT